MRPPDHARRRLLAVEGPNGAGKTLVAGHLATVSGARLLRYPPAFTEFRSRIRLDDDVAPLPRLAYYLAGIAHLSDEIAAEPGPAVCDRYFASPLAFLLADAAVTTQDLGEIASPILRRIVMPALTILLTADHTTLRRRLGERGETRAGASMRRTVDSNDFTASWVAHLRRLSAEAGNVVEIDTTDLDPESVCRQAEHAMTREVGAG